MTHTRRLAALLPTVSTIAALSGIAHAQTVTIPGGGAASPSADYAGPLVATNAVPTAPSEEFTFDSANAQYAFEYFASSSGKGQAAFSEDNPSALQYTGSTPLPSSIAYAGSDAFLASSGSTFPQTINGFTFTSPTAVTYPLLSTQDGALIQLPMLGVGIAIPAASGNKAVKANGKLQLTDADVCGIFSGTITDWGSIGHPLSGLTGQIDVYYRSDSSGNTFELTNHLKYACSGGFTAGQLALMPTTSFAGLFGGSNPTLPATFHGENGIPALAETLAGTVTTSGGSTVNNPGDPQGIGYVTADFTDISKTGAANATAASAPDTGFINTHALFTAAIEGVGTTKFLTPTTANVSTALSHAGAHSTNPKPPTGKNAANPLDWVPSVPLVKSGYAIVGYSNLILAQCYSDPNVAAGLVGFLTDHFSGQAAYKTTITNNGFVIPGATFAKAIIADFLTSSSKLGIAAAGTAGTCAGVSGR